MERKICRCKIYEVNGTNTNRKNGRKILILYFSSGMISSASVIKNPPANAGDIRNEGSVPGYRRSPVGEHGNPL